jgi:hypothetical protein
MQTPLKRSAKIDSLIELTKEFLEKN